MSNIHLANTHYVWAETIIWQHPTSYGWDVRYIQYILGRHVHNKCTKLHQKLNSLPFELEIMNKSITVPHKLHLESLLSSRELCSFYNTVQDDYKLPSQFSFMTK